MSIFRGLQGQLMITFNGLILVILITMGIYRYYTDTQASEVRAYNAVHNDIMMQKIRIENFLAGFSSQQRDHGPGPNPPAEVRKAYNLENQILDPVSPDVRHATVGGSQGDWRLLRQHVSKGHPDLDLRSPRNPDWPGDAL